MRHAARDNRTRYARRVEDPFSLRMRGYPTTERQNEAARGDQGGAEGSREDGTVDDGGYYRAAVIGFCIGCLGMEVQGSSVQPALVSIGPAMVLSVLTHAAVRGGGSELGALWAFSEEDRAVKESNSGTSADP
eukprot:3170969-Pyramimonas_sp.AAC.1